ncbi:MAG: VOC family protein [Armatimonadetes bacterium]|nr:VOC family protein [Armatimonadota bacterium]
MITAFHTIWCQTSDMDKGIAFYRDILGLTPGYTSQYWTEFDVGGRKLALHHAMEGTETPLGQHQRGWCLGIQTDDIRELKMKLDQAGAKLHGAYHDTPNGVVMDFEDPDGNPIQAIQSGLSSGDMAS